MDNVLSLIDYMSEEDRKVNTAVEFPEWTPLYSVE